MTFTSVTRTLPATTLSYGCLANVNFSRSCYHCATIAHSVQLVRLKQRYPSLSTMQSPHLQCLATQCLHRLGNAPISFTYYATLHAFLQTKSPTGLYEVSTSGSSQATATVSFYASTLAPCRPSRFLIFQRHAVKAFSTPCSIHLIRRLL